MERRDALKLIGGGTLGAAIASSSLAAFLTGCKTGGGVGGGNLTGTNLDLVGQICEIILPQTSTPGAMEAGVHNYIAKYLKEWSGEGESAKFMEGLKAFGGAFKKEVGSSFADATAEQQSAFVMKMANLELGEDEKPSAAQEFFWTLKGQSVGAYFSSELIGKEHLNYDPIPAIQQGCIPLEEASPGGILFSPQQ